MRSAIPFVIALVGCGSETLPDADEIGFIAFGSSANTVTVAWPAYEGATAYTIERGASDGELVPIATITPATSSFLDTGLAPMTTYSYRFTITTADGLTIEKPIQHPKTTDDELLITGDSTPIGLPITQTVGADGASIEIADAAARLVVPPGAVPDGTIFTLQPIASPYDGDPERGVSIVTTADITQPVDLVYALDELDAAAPDYVAIAVHQDDGTWVAEPRIINTAAGTATLTIPPGATRARSRAAPLIFHDTVKLRSTFVTPAKATVKVRDKLQLKAVGHFSDDPCDDADTREAKNCGVIVAIGVAGKTISPSDLRRPAYKFDKPLANSAKGYDRRWTVNGTTGGNSVVGTAVASGSFGATYTAPAAKPAATAVGDYVLVRFESVQTEPHRVATAVPAFLK
ncbi:MAG TPA: fibronectin type III domain-containing protein, partial [Acidimicrobiia bacterium]|nr:fibronectin type III domain-containing protein [Acidimicrobiia bacterium]